MLSASFPHRVSQESRELLVVLETVDPPAQSAPLVLPAPLESPAERWVHRYMYKHQPVQQSGGLQASHAQVSAAPGLLSPLYLSGALMPSLAEA